MNPITLEYHTFLLPIAVLVKSTAIAPAAFMLVLLVKKFGFKKLTNGAVAGLTASMAIISPYIFSGASLTMLFNSTLFRYSNLAQRVFSIAQRNRSTGRLQHLPALYLFHWSNFKEQNVDT